MSVGAAAQPQRFVSLIDEIRARAMTQPRGVSIGEMVETFGPKGHVFLTQFLVLPFLQPIPLPGISTLIGLCIALTGFLMVLQKEIKLPDRLAAVVFEARLLEKACSFVARVLEKGAKWVRPRGASLFHRSALLRLNGLFIFVHALMLSLPLPIPFSNFFPAVVLFLLAFSHLEEDALILVLAYIAMLANAAFFTPLIVVPYVTLRSFS